jgi:hypothetical protein
VERLKFFVEQGLYGGMYRKAIDARNRILNGAMQDYTLDCVRLAGDAALRESFFPGQNF